MKILVIDNAIEEAYWGAEDLRDYASRFPGATVYVRRAPQEDLPPSPNAFDRIVISGSKAGALENGPWVSQLHDFVRAAMEGSVPILGVCYGHQVIIRVMGGDDCVRKADRSELGWSEIETVKGSQLFSGLPEKFFSFSFHWDEVSRLPPSLKLTARSEICAIQAFEAQDKPIFGVQFHPERGIARAQEFFEFIKQHGQAKEFLHAQEGRKLYNPQVAETIFGNFFKLNTS